MTIQDDIKTLLAADSDLTDLFTGGIITAPEAGDQGLTPTTYKQGFDTRGRLKPTIVIKERARMPLAGSIANEAQALRATTQAVEIHFVQDRAFGFDTLQSGQESVYDLLADINVGGLRLIWREDSRNERSKWMERACSLWSVFDALGTRKRSE